MLFREDVKECLGPVFRAGACGFGRLSQQSQLAVHHATQPFVVVLAVQVERQLFGGLATCIFPFVHEISDSPDVVAAEIQIAELVGFLLEKRSDAFDLVVEHLLSPASISLPDFGCQFFLQKRNLERFESIEILCFSDRTFRPIHP